MHQSSDGKTVGVAALLKAGRPNATTQQLWEHMPTTKGGELEPESKSIPPHSPNSIRTMSGPFNRSTGAS